MSTEKELLTAALNLAAGELSTYPDHEHQSPDEVLTYLKDTAQHLLSISRKMGTEPRPMG